MNRPHFFPLLLLTLLTCVGSCLAQSVRGPIDFQLSADLQSHYESAPPSGATKESRQATIGHGKLMIDTGDPKSVFWSGPVDLTGVGSVANADMLWDSSTKVFYAFSHTDLRCASAKPIKGDILIAIYGKHNRLKKTQGSGWWVVDMAQDECGAPSPGLYGCKFDSEGTPLVCGHSEIDSTVNDLTIVESTRF